MLFCDDQFYLYHVFYDWATALKFTVAGAPVDFGNSRVLQNLIKEETFNPIKVVYGVPMPTWVLRQWVRVMTLTIKGKATTHTFSDLTLNTL